VVLINPKRKKNTGSALAGWLVYGLLLIPAAVQAAPLSLWKIEHDQAVVYLVGSVHVLKAADYPLPAAFQMAFDAAQITVFEVDLDKTSEPEVARFLVDEGRYQPPDRLSDNLLPSSLAALNRYLDSTHQSLEQYQQMKPWAISLNIAMIETQRLGYDAELGVDLYFQKQARAAGKPVLELESIQDQLRLLSGDSEALQELSLVSAISELPRFEMLLEDLMGAWRVGAADEMYALLLQSYSSPAAIEQMPLAADKLERQLAYQLTRILDTRNHEMAKKIRNYLQTSSEYFIVVGALHMGGPNGLIALLSEDHEIQQVHHSAK
jgi:uncharacterized protein YbaP (TraB family)